MSEPLDFCRVKKIDEKGYGFLKSLYYPCEIFFHFSQIKEQVFRDKLNNLKRGDFFLYFTSAPTQPDRRKVKKLWYSIEEVPDEMLHAFTKRIIEEFDEGQTNIFDLLIAFEGLKKKGMISKDELIKIMSSKRILNLPGTLLPYLNKEEKKLFEGLLDIGKYKNVNPKPFWYSDFVDE